jgi:hypothetical protein
MKRVFQTEFGERGNCFEACLASILELDDVYSVPRNTESNQRVQDYFERLDRRLLHGCGLQIVAINVPDKTEKGKPDRLPDHVSDDVWWIAHIKPADEAPFHHAVVMRGRELAHDPDPKRTYTAGLQFADRIACVILLVVVL